MYCVCKGGGGDGSTVERTVQTVVSGLIDIGWVLEVLVDVHARHGERAEHHRLVRSPCCGFVQNAYLHGLQKECELETF